MECEMTAAEPGEDHYAQATAQSRILSEDLAGNPGKYRVLSGDRPTGLLHIGHLFGSLRNRLELQNAGVETLILIADYQVFTDREHSDSIHHFTLQLCLDYLAIGLDPERPTISIFLHSQIPELNQLIIPFLTLVSQRELERNPTTKDELAHASIDQMTGALLTYPVHQAADILFCRSNVIPVGKDQLPHIEIARNIARRFNQRYSPEQDFFPRPQALLSETPAIGGLDGSSKMSKSRKNAIPISATADETAQLIKHAKTDSQRLITYDPEGRPEVANLIQLIRCCSQEAPETIAERIGDGGASRLKAELTERLNEYLRPIRERRRALEQDIGYVYGVLHRGCERARTLAIETLRGVNQRMGTYLPPRGNR